jgi:hypothetical protein
MKRRGKEKQREKSRVTGARRGRGGGAFMAVYLPEIEEDRADLTLEEMKSRRITAIKKEKSRLAKQFKEIDKKSRAVVDGLIEQAAFLRVQLQELADNININGTTELFAQGKDQEPYERQRPAANVYNSMNANYQKIIKQLNELLPKPVKNTEVKDGFRDFVNGRDVF